MIDRGPLSRTLGAIVLTIVGAYLVISGVQHLVGTDALQSHYIALGWPSASMRAVGVLQCVAGTLLLVPRTAPTAAIGVGLVMLAALVLRLVRTGTLAGGRDAAILLAVCVAARLLVRRVHVSRLVLSATCTLLALGARSAHAQRGVIAGRVVSAGTSEPVAGAQIRVLDTPRATVADSAGRFVVPDVPVGVRRLEVRRIGFAPRVVSDVVVSVGRAAELTIELEPIGVRLGDVTVRPSYFPTRPPPVTPLSTQTLTAEEIRRAPGVQEDVVRAVSVLPGVSVVNPVANDIVVRGGGTAENLFVVDDVEVPSINHFATPGGTGGVLSVFPVALVSEASLSAGGFGARYGDRTSSATTVALREGSSARAASQLTFSATGVGAIVESPLGSRASIIAGARRSYLDLLFKAIGLPFIPTYTDLTTKVVARPSRRDRVSAFVAGSVDRLSTSDASADDRYDVSRIIAPSQDAYFSGVTWQRTFARGVVATTLGRTWSRFRTTQLDSGGPSRAPDVLFRVDAEEGETSLRSEGTYEMSPRMMLSAGGVTKYASRLRYTAFGPGVPSIDTSFTAWRGALYTQATARPTDRTQLTVGLRADDYAFLAGGVTRAAPRVAVSLQLDEASAVTLSGGRYWQPPPFAWLVGDPGNAAQLRPFRADQAIASWSRTLRADVKVQIEAYAKRYASYPSRLDHPRAVLQPTGNDDASADVPLGLVPLASAGTGHAVGIEAFAQKKLSEIPVYALLSVSVNRTRFRALDGVRTRGAFDLPVGVNALAGWRPNAKWELSGRVRGGSGLPTTPFVTTGSDVGTLDFTRYNAGPRLAPYFSLDVRADRRWQLGGGRRGQLVGYLDVQDLTARRNETYPIYDQRERRVSRQLFAGFLPSIGLTWER